MAGDAGYLPRSLRARLELVTYFRAGATHLMQAAAVLRQQDRLDAATARLATLPARFTLQLISPPDPRFDARHVPCWGHEGHWVTLIVPLVPGGNEVTIRNPGQPPVFRSWQAW